MTRSSFMTTLRRGMDGLPPQEIDDIIADYENHFAEAAAAGRSEADTAAALGDPARLAKELRAEAGFKRWEAQRTPRNLAGAVLALLGLATVDLMFLLPFLPVLLALFIAFGAAALGLFVAGIAVSMVGIFPALAWFGLSGDVGGPVALILLGIGLLAGGVGLGALTWMAADFTVRLLVRYARLHFQLINDVTV